jgi:hypothetical protein
VTNPPLDPIRESVVMSLRMRLGRHGSFLVEHPRQARLLRVDHPVLLEEEMAALRSVPGFSCVTISTTWPASEGTDGLGNALTRLLRDAERAARKGARLLVLSDRVADRERVPIPMLLALGAVRRHLLDKGLRLQVGLVAEVGDAWDVHHAATLFGYGAEAIYPWLALESVAAQEAENADECRRRYRSALEYGLLKIMSKMGIAVLPSYCGAQIFEALGLGSEVIDFAFRSTPSHLGGLGFEEIAEDALTRHRAAWLDESDSLPDFGRIRFRKDGEDHGWAPNIVVALQKATGSGKTAKTDETDKTDETAKAGEFDRDEGCRRFMVAPPPTWRRDPGGFQERC